MSQLSAQSIKDLCLSARMIEPFVEERTVVNGKSYGLSGASYDVRIAHDLTLGPSPDRLLAAMLAQHSYATETIIEEWRRAIRTLPPCHALAHTVEDFDMPKDVVGYVVDKSSYARRFVSAFNTLIDAGFRGNLTLELVNLGSETVHIAAGDPICQIAFHWLDKETSRPYASKYQGQTKAAHGPRYERADGSWSHD